MLKKPVVMFQSDVEINNITKEQTIFMKTNSLGPCQDGNYQFTVRIDKTIVSVYLLLKNLYIFNVFVAECE